MEKKTNNKINKEVKKVNKKTNNKVNKEVNKKVKKKKLKIIPKEKNERILFIIFIVLLISVIALAFITVDKKKEYEAKQTDITIPIIEENVNNTLNVDISNLSKGALKEYKFKITNYKDKKVNSEKLVYNIYVDALENDVTIKLYKSGNEKNLFKDLKKYEISNVSLPKNKKSDDLYTLIVKASSNIENKKSVEIKITSTN